MGPTNENGLQPGRVDSTKSEDAPTEAPFRGLTPEQRAKAKEQMDRLMTKLIEAMHHDNMELGLSAPPTGEPLKPLTAEEIAETETEMAVAIPRVIAAMAEDNKELASEDVGTEPPICISLAPTLTEDGYEEIMRWAAAQTISIPVRTLLEIWQADDPERMRELARTGKLLPLLRRLESNLDLAQDLRCDPSNLGLPMFEILQMAEVPLRVPRANA